VMVPRENPGAIAQAVARLERDPALRLTLGAGARKTGGRYDIIAFVHKMEHLYELLHRVSRPTKRQGLLTEDLSFLDGGRLR
jgi:hypothetical protein